MQDTHNDDLRRNSGEAEPVKFCKGNASCNLLFTDLLDKGELFGIIYVGVHDFAGSLKDADETTAAQASAIITSRLMRCVRGDDSAFQVNDTDYLVVIRGAYVAGAYESLQERIRSAIEEEISLANDHLYVSASFGFASCPENGNTMEELIEGARKAMERSLHSAQRASALEKELLAEEQAIQQQDDDDQSASAMSSMSTSVSTTPHQTQHQYFDVLTGLPNEQLFRIKANELISDANTRLAGLTMVFCDVEEFKTFNLKYGYMAGDDLLKFMADALVEAFPDQLIARLNSDRFCVLAATENVIDSLESIHSQLKQFRSNTSVEFKAGIYDVLDENVSATQAQDYARLACDSIKGRYDMYWRRYDAHLAGQISRRQYIMDNLTMAINAGWIEVYYQPIIRSLSGHVCGLEALVRWNDPELGMLPPAEFIDVLEDAHLIHNLDIEVVRQVCEAGVRKMKSGDSLLGVSVNLSRLDYQLCDIFSVVDEIVTKYGFPREMLHIEFTETAFTHDAEYFKQVINRFRKVGYQVWMDDFGSGYSSLNLLKDYEFDVLKIDMGFLRGLADSARTRDILVSVVDMAKKLNIYTLAEGVETEEQSQILRSIGCEMQQGYLFSKPVPEDELDKVFAELCVENPADGEYYRDLGHVNLLSAAPFELPEDELHASGMSLVPPLAIIQREDDEMKAIVSTSSFKEAIDDLDIHGEDGVIRIQGNDKCSRLAQEILRLGDASDVEGNVQTSSLYDYHHFYALRVQHVASSGERKAYLVSLEKHNTSKESLMTISNDTSGTPEVVVEASSTNRLVYLPQAQPTAWQQTKDIDLSRTALLVIDVLGGSEGVAPGLEGAAENSVKLAKAAREAQVPVIFCCDNHLNGIDRELELWGDHGVCGTQSSTPLDDFEVSDKDYVIPKRRYNAFFQTDLDITLRELDVDTLILVGYDTNICVNHTLAGAYYLGYKTVVPADATATFLVGEQDAGLEYFVRCYDTRVVDTKTVMEYFSKK